MKCLWLTREYPLPAFSGDKIYTLNIAEQLAETGVKVTVTCCTSEPKTTLDEASFVSWQLVNSTANSPYLSLFSTLPNVAKRYYTSRYQSKLKDLLANDHWDYMIVDHLGMGWALPELLKYRLASKKVVKIVYLSHDHEESVRYQMARNYKGSIFGKAWLKYDAKKAEILERRLAKSSDIITVNTETDFELFKVQCPDHSYCLLKPGYRGKKIVSRKIESSTPRQAIIIGAFNWLAKRMNVEEFLAVADPLFVKAGVKILVVGQGSQTFFDQMNEKFSATTFTGKVESVSPYLSQARIGIVAEPIGGGFKHKVLDYIFNRVAVVALRGSVAGMNLLEEKEILYFDDITSLAKGVIDTLDNLEYLNRLQTAAYKKCDSLFNWKDCGNSLRNVLLEN